MAPPAQANAPSGGKAEKPGFFRRLRQKILPTTEELKKFKKGLSGLEPVPSGPVKLTAYRRRAAEKLAQMHDREKATEFDRAAELGVLRVWLDDLLDDLRSVGAAEADTAALLALKEKLAGDRSDAAGLWQEALAVLQAFANGTAGKKSRKRQGFWK
jgi:hypothetical protein